MGRAWGSVALVQSKMTLRVKEVSYSLRYIRKSGFNNEYNLECGK